MNETKTNFEKGIKAFFGKGLIFVFGIAFINGNMILDNGTIILISFVVAVIAGIYFTFFDIE